MIFNVAHQPDELWLNVSYKENTDSFCVEKLELRHVNMDIF